MIAGAVVIAILVGVSTLLAAIARPEDSEAGNVVDAILEQCHLTFPTKVAPMMRRRGPFGFGGMTEPWRLHFS